MVTKSVQSESSKRAVLVYNFSETEKVVIAYEHLLESFTLFEIDIYVDQLFDKYAQLNDEEINMNFDHTNIKSHEMMKKLPEAIQTLFSKCEEEVNSYDEESNTIIYKHKCKLMPKSSIQKFVDEEILTVLESMIEKGETEPLSGELFERMNRLNEQLKKVDAEINK